MRVLFTPRAETHLSKIYDYVALHSNEDRAGAFVRRIIAYCGGFATFPERGARRDDLLPGLRTIGFERSITIAFIVMPTAVLIEGIHYGGQDYETVYL
ncbi:type II toxin-antitoxin system RelE/ParE family toxin [Acidisoma cellulosilytica]|uniref:Type II toxin-antitoxin system RelE/ParE family toxin n=1 Tax=Acidisoma cellulosilyticum TaxID=2802395 RepID=A0A963Z4D2_9PROT|nr:type II toxin-antitoxin system RelE/ParE family toxin [Acidisoma cellulosilyticum]MCB8882399.1 type II toxin-antitoxin system RelE/ParE family toxin [Acidisoma cellulosilyticum]